MRTIFLLLIICFNSVFLYSELIVDVNVYGGAVELENEAISFGLSSAAHETKAPTPPVQTKPRAYFWREDWPVAGINTSMTKDYRTPTAETAEWKLVVSVPITYTDPITLSFDASGFAVDGNLTMTGGAYTNENIALDFTAPVDRLAVTNGIYTISYVSTLSPALGLEATQDGAKLTWSVEEEIGVKEYKLVDSKTGQIIDTVVANELGEYEYTLEDASIEVTLVVIDSSGFKQTYLPEEGSVVRVSYELNPGWNLVAMPGANADISELIDVTTGAFWGWDGSTYFPVDNPEAGQGIWVFSEKSQNVLITAEESEVNLEINPGWNLTGPVENCEVPECADAVFTWNSDYENVLENDNILLRGVGYWIFSVTGN